MVQCLPLVLEVQEVVVVIKQVVQAQEILHQQVHLKEIMAVLEHS